MVGFFFPKFKSAKGNSRHYKREYIFLKWMKVWEKKNERLYWLKGESEVV